MSASTAVVLEGLRDLASDPAAMREVRAILGLVVVESRPELESTTHAATRLGLAVKTVERMCRDGRLPGALKVGNAWRVPCDAVPGGAGDLEGEQASSGPRRARPRKRQPTPRRDGATDAMQAVIEGRIRGGKTTPRVAPASPASDRGRGPMGVDPMDMPDPSAPTFGGATVTPITSGVTK